MVLPEAIIMGIIALGVGIGGGWVGGRKTAKDSANVTAIKAAVSEAMTTHLGNKNGEIKQDIADIKAFMTVSCPSTHKLVDSRLDTLEAKK